MRIIGVEGVDVVEGSVVKKDLILGNGVVVVGNFYCVKCFVFFR